MNIREPTIDDLPAILDLYRRVARTPGGLARLEREVDAEYVEGFLSKALDSGLAYIAVSADRRVIGEIHAYSPKLYCFSHVLSDLTIAVDPGSQGTGVGRNIFDAFMRQVRGHLPQISRVELIARESNDKAIRFYKSMGFEREGMLRNRIKNPDGSVESDIPMAWTREK